MEDLRAALCAAFEEVCAGEAGQEAAGAGLEGSRGKLALMLGWPLAVLVLVGVGVVTHFISSLTPSLLRSNRDRIHLLTKFTSTIWNTSKQNDTTLRAT